MRCCVTLARHQPGDSEIIAEHGNSVQVARKGGTLAHSEKQSIEDHNQMSNCPRRKEK